MGAALSYSLASSVVILLLYPLLHRMVNNWAAFRQNRIFLLAAITTASIVPPAFMPQRQFGLDKLLSDNGSILLVESVDSTDEITLSSIVSIAIAVYVSVIVILAIREIIAFINLFRLLQRCKKQICGDYILCTPPDNSISPFSWGKYIVMPNSCYHDAILQHELAHKRRHHMIDVIIADVFCIVLWYNPFAWLTRSLIKQNHEYEADAAAIRSGIDACQYQKLLITSAMGKQFSPIAHSFTSRLQCLRQRIISINNPDRGAGRQKLIAISTTACLVCAIMVLNLPLFAKTSENLSGYSLTRPYIYGSGPTYIADLHRDGTIVSSENIEITPSTDSSIQTYSLQFMSTNGDSSEKIFIRLHFDSNGTIVRSAIDGNSNATINHSDDKVTVTMSTNDGKTLTSRLQISKPTKQ